jgi:2,3-dihydroxy-p-cumate/2,3-dihydroxybenzoate 3,4-dioxygenase
MSKNLAPSVAYARIQTRRLDESAQFAVNFVGLDLTKTSSTERGFRTDARRRSIMFFCDDADESSIGIELADDESFSEASTRLAAQGFETSEGSDSECKRRLVGRLLKTRDASGNRIELVIRQEFSARRVSPGEAGIVGFQGVGMRSIDLAGDLRFWTKAIGARISDRVGDIAYLGLDARHHRIALYPSRRRGIFNLALEVESEDLVMQNAYRLQARQVRMAQGPGREPASGQTFLHFKGPDDILFSYVSGMRLYEEPYPRPRQFALSEESLCLWGSVCTEIPELRTDAKVGN